MATTIPYDSSLDLGDIVTKEKLTTIEEISALQTQIDSVYNKLNLNIQLKKNLDMTMLNLMDMNVDTSEIKAPLKEVQKEILDSAKEYAKITIANSKEITKKKSKIRLVNSNIESPIDYAKTQIKTMPLSADSLKMDAQYFSFDENKQNAKNTMASIKNFVSASTEFISTERSFEVSDAVQSQINSQIESHDIAGTLIITASCTHKNAALLSPFVLDVDKAVRIWNELHPQKLIKTNNVGNMQQIAKEEGTCLEEKLHILSGATYGSSFVGMVHVLRSSSTETSQNMVSVASSMQAKMSAGCWFADVSGGFGTDESFANDVKKMLSSQDITSHISLVTMGSIPIIKSNEVSIAVKEFAKFDPSEMIGKLATLQNATMHDKDSINASAEAARTGGKMMAIRGAEIKNVMMGLGVIDDGKNKILDINSLMTAFEDYAQKALQGNIGVPINYYLKPVTRVQLAQMWVSKYYPNKYLSIDGDDIKQRSTSKMTGSITSNRDTSKVAEAQKEANPA
jgi:hypothetical protein